MPTTTSKLLLPKPLLDGSDNADVPEDIGALADRLEAVLTAGDDSTWSAGDFKTSARPTTHGRWLLCDGTEKTQAEIETAGSLNAGDGAALVALLGTGAASAYGSAAVGKVRLPDPRGRVPVGVGAGTGLTSRARAAVGGVETVVLTAGQTGVPAHSHNLIGAITAETGHVHPFSGTTGTESADHSHTVNNAQHVSDVLVSSGTATLSPNSSPNTTMVFGVEKQFLSAYNSGRNAAHTHYISGQTGAGSSHTHANTLEVVNHAGTAATSHENMPPFVALGSVFIRV